jgi:integrase
VIFPWREFLRALLDLRRYATGMGPSGPTAAVFGNEFGRPLKHWLVNSAWREICAAAGITGMHFHDLRRELASLSR